jgi:1-aminocyclopropane-1-carboxylate deaminase
MFLLPSPLQQLFDEKLAGVHLWVKRDDLIHPQISGNKWRKLKYNFLEARKLDKTTILTFGGAFSNHIHATAAAGKLLGFQTIGIIRGEKCTNPTLQFAEECGMKLFFISRDEYRHKNETFVLEKIKTWVAADFFLIPEGGANDLGIQGCTEILPEINMDFDYVCCPVGTGTTLSGINATLQNHQKSLGFSALKLSKTEKTFGLAEDFEFVKDFSAPFAAKFALVADYHFGGYAKTMPQLFEFIHYFEQKHGFQLEQVYTGKMFFGIYDLIEKGFFKKGETIVALHTGGLQGRNF